MKRPFGLKSLFRRPAPTEAKSVEGVFDQYCQNTPHHQNAIDALPGWNSAFPPEAGVTAGNHPLFADGRVAWALEKAGSIENKRILEIGPLEGMHTYMLNRMRPSTIDAVEANTLCYLRCLVTKEILNIDRAHFYLGDAVNWLAERDIKYDVAFASGVLYHMADPGEFLCQIASRCESLFIWTHYFDEHAMPAGDNRRAPFSGRVENRTLSGVAVRYVERGYFNANVNTEFCGGMRDRHYWMYREDILSLLRALGFGDISIAHENPDHSGGPCFSVFARRNAIK